MPLEDLIKEINIIRTQPNDVIVFKVPIEVISREREHIHAFVQMIKDATGRLCMVIPLDFEIEVIRDGVDIHAASVVDNEARRIRLKAKD